MACRIFLPLATAMALAVSLAILQAAFAHNMRNDFLNAHNAAREEVGVEPLRWNYTLADYSQNYVDEMVGDCHLKHSHGPYGENIYLGRGFTSPAYDAVEKWVRERDYYDYNSNSCDPDWVCGHYTQVVWRDTKRVGCGWSQCANGADYVVCSYDPKGNWEGQWPYAIST